MARGTADARSAKADEQLVQAAQEGDNRAFDELVRRYQDRVYRLSYRILRNEDDAGEALQDAFLSAYRGLKGFRADARFSTWLFRIATNASLMKHRRRRHDHVSLERSQDGNGEAEPLQLPDRSAQPPDELLTAEMLEVIAEGLQGLSGELRAVFVLRDLEMHANAEVAEILGLSVPAMKSRLHRARIALRGRLAAYLAGRVKQAGVGRQRRWDVVRDPLEWQGTTGLQPAELP